ncbi:Cullin-1 [Geodia barretti]|nr:Cullin-1 [Geodia barretti]
MVVDMKLSEDCMASFQEHLSISSSSLPLAFTTLVLQSAAWPFSKPTGNFNVPPQMLSVIEKFERFYETKYTGRKLSWLYHMSLGDLRLNYLKKQYTVSATTHQMAYCWLSTPLNNTPSAPCYSTLDWTTKR